MNKSIRVEALVKAERMLKSCQTIEQLDVASRYLDLAGKGAFLDSDYQHLLDKKADAYSRLGSSMAYILRQRQKIAILQSILYL